MEKSASQHTLDETFESLTPYEPEEPPPIEQVDTPPPIPNPKAEHSKIKTKLSALASPFKSSKGFHLGPIKRSKLAENEDSDRDVKEVKNPKKSKKGKKAEAEEVEADVEGALSDDDTKKKKKGKRSKAGALVRRLGSLGGRKHEGVKEGADERRPSSASSSLTPGSVKRQTPDGEDGSEPSVHDESGSRYGSVEEVDMRAPLADEETLSDSTVDATPEKPSEEIIDIPSIATTHPVSTLPFSVSTWKPKSTKVIEIEKPIEPSGPEDALRKRISFVEQSEIGQSEDRESPESGTPPQGRSSPVARLSRMVELARLQRLSGEHHTPPHSRSPSPNVAASHPEEPERTDDEEEFEDTEGTTTRPEPVMPPYGDIIDAPDSTKPEMGAGVSSNPSTLGSDRREHLYKILVIGELGTGKTSIIKRYVHQFFSQHYRATIGVDFALKVLNWDANTTVRLQLWDIAGQERFGNMTRVYYKEAVGAFVVFDVTRVATFDAVVKWKQDLDSKVQLPDGSPIPCVLLANKCDQQKEGIVNNQAKMDEYCKEKGFASWYETSAKENINIEEAARALVNRILYNDKFVMSGDSKESTGFALDGRNPNGEASSSSKCPC